MNLIDLSEHLTVISTGTYDQSQATGDDVTVSDKHAAAAILINMHSAKLAHVIAHVVGPVASNLLRSALGSTFVTTVADDDGVNVEISAIDGVPVWMNPRSDGINTVGMDINGNLVTTRIDLLNVTFE